MANRGCPVCDSQKIFTVGPVLHPRPSHVAGVEIDLSGTTYWIRGCQECGFQFKDPPIDAERLISCYEQAASDKWETDPSPTTRQFDVLCDVVEKHAVGRRILDVGCFNGALLSYFGNDWQRFGIEPSQAAAELAQSRGVHVLAPTLDEFNTGDSKFDVIVAIDVVEHIVDPLPFFHSIRELLAPSGIFLILTGDTDSLAWQMQSSFYWYCSLPEHVSFYSRRTLDWIGSQLGLAGVEYQQLCHKRLPLWWWCRDALKSGAYIVGRKAQGFGIPPLRRLFLERRGPSIQSARDHLIYVFQKMD